MKKGGVYRRRNGKITPVKEINFIRKPDKLLKIAEYLERDYEMVTPVFKDVLGLPCVDSLKKRVRKRYREAPQSGVVSKKRPSIVVNISASAEAKKKIFREGTMEEFSKAFWGRVK